MSDATFALGERLVAELKLVESTDTLARWMAHYLAELMALAESAPLPERDEARQSCARVILDLWAHARAFPVKRAAFESIDRVIETIESLHPDGEPHYRNNLWRALEAHADDEDSEIGKLLTAALAIDGGARNLIHHVLAQASYVAGRDCAEWLELAQHLDEEDSLTKLRIRIVGMGRDEGQLRKHRIERLEKRIAQLDYFNASTQELKASLLESLTCTKADGDMLGRQHEDP